MQSDCCEERGQTLGCDSKTPVKDFTTHFLKRRRVQMKVSESSPACSMCGSTSNQGTACYIKQYQKCYINNNLLHSGGRRAGEMETTRHCQLSCYKVCNFISSALFHFQPVEHKRVTARSEQKVAQRNLSEHHWTLGVVVMTCRLWFVSHHLTKQKPGGKVASPSTGHE